MRFVGVVFFFSLQLFLIQSALAFPFMGSDNSQAKSGPIQSFQPPSPDAIKLQCEPYRHQAAVLEHRVFLIRPFYQPKRIWLMYQYRHCVRLYMDQENVYLHHVNIEQPPSLPKLEIPPSTVTQPVAPTEKQELKGGSHVTPNP